MRSADSSAPYFFVPGDPAVINKPQAADRRPSKCRGELPINRNRLLQMSQSFDNSFFCYRIIDRQRAQIEFISVEVTRRPRGGAAHLGHLQGRLDDTGNADSNLVLQSEHVFQRAIKAVGPQMRATERVDQLCGERTRPPALRTEPSKT